MHDMRKLSIEQPTCRRTCHRGGFWRVKPDILGTKYLSDGEAEIYLYIYIYPSIYDEIKSNMQWQIHAYEHYESEVVYVNM
jgi:hypothetical protein